MNDGDFRSWLSIVTLIRLECTAFKCSHFHILASCVQMCALTASQDPQDEELWVIADFLEKTKAVSDVRDYVEFWREGAQVLNEEA